MKKLVLFFVAAVLTVAELFAGRMYPSALEGKYMYVYRNDSIRFMSIAYDKLIGMEVGYSDSGDTSLPDIQTIETADTVYHIPLEAIDSIAFHTPSTVMADAAIDLSYDHAPYILGNKGLNLCLSASTPSGLRPRQGDVLFTWGVAPNLTGGFAGRVRSSHTAGDTLVVVCDSVRFGEVFDRFYGRLEPVAESMSRSVDIPENVSPIEISLSLEDLFSVESESDVVDKLIERPDLKEVFKSKTSVGVGLNKLKLSVYPQRFAPSLYCFFNEESSQFNLEFGLDYDLTIALDFDLAISGTIGVDVDPSAIENCVGRIQSSLEEKLKDKGKIFNSLFEKLNMFEDFCFKHNIRPEAKLYLTSGFIAGVEGRCRICGFFDATFDFWDCVATALAPKVALPILILQGNRLYPESCGVENVPKYIIFNGGFGIGLGAKIVYYEDEKCAISSAVGAEYSVEGQVPLWVNSSTVSERETSVYKSLIDNNALSIDANAVINLISVEAKLNNGDTSLAEGINWNAKGDLGWSIYELAHVPTITKPVYFDSESRQFNYMADKETLYEHRMGAVAYDEKTGETILEWDEINYYKDPAETNAFSIQLPGMKPNRDYTVYPVIDQAAHTRWFDPDPLPLLAEPSVKVRFDSTPVTDGANVPDDEKAEAILYGHIENTSYLNGTQYEAGFEVWCGDAAPVRYSSQLASGKLSLTVSDLNFSTTYSYRAYLKIDDDFTYGETLTFTTPSGPFVDLGLSVKWASKNMGSETASDKGYYYQWGALTGSTACSWDNYFDNPYGESGDWVGCTKVTDDIVSTSYDVVSHYYNGSARMPSADEMQELVDKCTWTWTTLDGVSGYEVTGPNGATIFLPATGQIDGSGVSNAEQYGGYWSGSIATTNTSSARILYFYGSMMHSLSQSNRYVGRPIRAVCDM